METLLVWKVFLSVRVLSVVTLHPGSILMVCLQSGDWCCDLYCITLSPAASVESHETCSDLVFLKLILAVHANQVNVYRFLGPSMVKCLVSVALDESHLNGCLSTLS